MDVQDLPCAMDTIDTNSYAFLAIWVEPRGVRLVDDGVIASLSSDIPVPLSSVFALRFTGTAATATWLANCASSAWLWWLGPSTRPVVASL